jgi:hypothetical protein
MRSPTRRCQRCTVTAVDCTACAFPSALQHFDVGLLCYVRIGRLFGTGFRHTRRATRSRYRVLQSGWAEVLLGSTVRHQVLVVSVCWDRDVRI